MLWVVDTGRPKRVALVIHRPAASIAAMKPKKNSGARSSISCSERLRTPLRTVSVTASPANIAPANSKTAARMTAWRNVRARLPTLGPIALETSLAPMFQAMWRAMAMATPNPSSHMGPASASCTSRPRRILWWTIEKPEVPRLEGPLHSVSKIYDSTFGPGMARSREARTQRRLQLTGGATYTVSLPKEWVISHGLEAKDSISIEQLAGGDLRLSPAHRGPTPKRIVVLRLDTLPQGSLMEHLVACYLAGADRIELRSDDGLERSHRRLLRDFAQGTRGMEITVEDDHHAELIGLLNAAELPFRVSLNRMYLLTTGLVRDAIETLDGGDAIVLDDIEEREREIDALRLLIERQVALCLDTPHIEQALAVSRRQASQYGMLARALERMGDHAWMLAQLVRDADVRPRFDANEYPLAAGAEWQDALKTLLHHLSRPDPIPVTEARRRLERAARALEEHENGLWASTRQAPKLLFEFRISEGLRRLCRYALDFSETLVNLHVLGKVIEERSEELPDDED